MVFAQRYLPITNGIQFPLTLAFSYLVVVSIASGAGLLEDLTHKLAPRSRMLLTLAAALAAAWLLDARIQRLGIGQLDAVLSAVPWLAAVLAIFAIAGLPHAFNLIDGYNGLAGIVAVICCFAIAYVSLLVGDRPLAGVAVALAGATCGFLLWNYPRGLIFAGDGGAYLWGSALAVLSIQLVQRHDAVSPWFPALLFIYPVWETVFSIYRKLVRGQSPGVADALHFHQLIYRRIVREVFDDSQARRMLIRNNRTSPYLWGFTILTVVPAVLLWQNTAALMAFCLVFIASYIYCYFSIVRFKVPDWLRR